MKNTIGRILEIIITATILILALDLTVILSTRDSITDTPTPADCILILGCGVHDDGTPSDMLRDRLEKGMELYHRGAAEKILISGDNGQIAYNEIQVMLNYLLDNDIPPKDIFCDHAGFSTYDSIHRSNSIFGAQSIIIVTQKYHEYRALFIAERLGIRAQGCIADTVKYRGQVYREIREIIARDKDLFKALLRFGPTYGGVQIPLTGDSQLSW